MSSSYEKELDMEDDYAKALDLMDFHDYVKMTEENEKREKQDTENLIREYEESELKNKINRPFALLKIYIEKKLFESYEKHGETLQNMMYNYEETKKMYKEAIEKHNHSILNSATPNSGFDLFVLQNTFFDNIKYQEFITENNGLHKKDDVKMVDFGIKTEMEYFDFNTKYPTGFCLYPRSSIYKTPLMLCNHVGVIDAGYRGNIKGAFRNVSPSEELYVLTRGERVLQICHGTLCPIYVYLVDDENELNLNTERGEGGFGSTNK
jgi:dUTP pyrophosphatase